MAVRLKAKHQGKGTASLLGQTQAAGRNLTLAGECLPGVREPERLGGEEGSREGLLDTYAESLSKSAFSWSKLFWPCNRDASDCSIRCLQSITCALFAMEANHRVPCQYNEAFHHQQEAVLSRRSWGMYRTQRWPELCTWRAKGAMSKAGQLGSLSIR